MLTTFRVPHFPQEDTKLRATKIERRRGGNTGNALEVFTQLLPQAGDTGESIYSSEQYLFTVLPEYLSEDTKTVMRSLPRVSSDLFQFRKNQPLAASSYIIQSAQNQSRTIVSANPLDEMTAEEFKAGVAPLIDDPKIGNGDVWIHFEGRVPEVLLPCVTWLRETYGYEKKVKISLECEKPDRVGLKDVVPLVDLVFYSKIWAEVSTSTISRLASGLLKVLRAKLKSKCQCLPSRKDVYTSRLTSHRLTTKASAHSKTVMSPRGRSSTRSSKTPTLRQY